MIEDFTDPIDPANKDAIKLRSDALFLLLLNDREALLNLISATISDWTSNDAVSIYEAHAVRTVDLLGGSYIGAMAEMTMHLLHARNIIEPIDTPHAKRLHIQLSVLEDLLDERLWKRTTED